MVRRTVGSMEIVTVDVETTGLGPDAELVEFAAVDDSGSVLFQALLRPSDPWGYIAEEVHGITARELAAAPRFEDLADEIFNVLDGRVLSAHGAEFDHRCIMREFSRLSMDAPRPAGLLCTMALAGRLFRGGQRISLSSSLAAAGIPEPDGRAHRAVHDAQAARLLRKACERRDAAA